MQLSPLAIQKAKEAILKTGNENTMLRVGVKGGGCNGYSYILEFTTQSTARDSILDFDGVKIVIDPKSATLLHNTTLDYEIKLMEYGFKFVNPEIKSECGCGKSFSI